MTKPIKYRHVRRIANRLVVARTACMCGARYAYDPRNHKGRWHCSAILLRTALPNDRVGSVTHSDTIPFVFWKVSTDRNYHFNKDELRAAVALRNVKAEPQ